MIQNKLGHALRKQATCLGDAKKERTIETSNSCLRSGFGSLLGWEFSFRTPGRPEKSANNQNAVL
jgi:hypothetical protein